MTATRRWYSFWRGTTAAAAAAAFLLSATTAVATHHCATDDDCSLNGVCGKDGACVCDKPWGDVDCSKLQFLPAPISSCGDACAYHAMDPRNTSWGGSVIRGGDDGRYYMAAAEMHGGCGLNTWQTNSQVAIAVSDDGPLGPYTKQQVAVQPWAHNPQIVRAATGEYLIFSLGNGTAHGRMKRCGGGTTRAGAQQPPAPPMRDFLATHTSASAGTATVANKSVGFVIHYATSLAGPWKAHTATIPNFRGQDNMGNWNPAPVVLPDGTIRVMVHTDPAPWAGEVIVEARNGWRGPYERITGDVMSYCTRCQEDPFMWRDPRGRWHALLHKMFDPPGRSPIPSPGWSGGHIYSRDGLTWSHVQRCYSTNVTLEGGGLLVTKRRERPKLIFNEAGVPTHLTNGVETAHGGTYTMIAPLAV